MKQALLSFFALILWALPSVAQDIEMKAPPQWSSGCDKTERDQFGEKKRAYCWLFVNNLGNSGSIMDDNSWVIKHATLFEIDRAGLHLIKPKKTDSLCSGTPRKIAVDGKRIDNLAGKDQITAVLKGSKLVWETQALWPYCGIAPSGTYLTGLGAAIEELKFKWNEGAR